MVRTTRGRLPASPSLCFLAERVAAQVLQALLTTRGLGIDLQELSPGFVGALPVLARFRDRGERLQRGKAVRLALQRRLNAGDCARRIAGCKTGNGALMICLREVRFERDSGGEVFDGI